MFFLGGKNGFNEYRLDLDAMNPAVLQLSS